MAEKLTVDGTVTTIRPTIRAGHKTRTHARNHGTVFLAYAEDAVARIHTRLGFRPADTTLLIAHQPARS